MKHFFCISSHLAFSICDRLIQLDGLSIDDCVFLTTRNYRLPANASAYKVVETELNATEKEGRLFAGWRVLKTLRNVRHFDRFIDACTQGEDYLFYTQICWNDICSVCVTNPHCKGYYIIEDGYGSYRKEELQTFHGGKAFLFRYVLKPIFPRIYTLKGKMVEVNHPKFRGCIATNEWCFPLHQDNTRVIGFPFHPEPLEKIPQAIISLDPYYLWLTEAQVEQVIKQLGDYINSKHYTLIAYKPHPYLFIKANAEKNILYRQWLHQYIDGELQELDDRVSLENTLMAHRNCDFYTAVSSVAIYAKAMGIRCYTFAPLLRQFSDIQAPIVE